MKPRGNFTLISVIPSAFIAVSALVLTMLVHSPDIAVAALGNTAQFTLPSNSFIAATSSSKFERAYFHTPTGRLFFSEARNA
jgi:hypothetical protein